MQCKLNVAVIEDSDCDETGEMPCATRTTDAVNRTRRADDTDTLIQAFLAAVEMQFSSTSMHCSIVSVKKASATY